MLDDLNDPLDDLFGGTVQGEKPRPTPPASYKPADYSEPCRKCGGSGRFRNFGPCFACKGRGANTFKTSPEQRAAARERSAAKVRDHAEQLAEQIKVWCETHKAVHQWLGTAMQRNAQRAGNFTFPAEMLGAVARYGSLTAGQLAAVERLMARDEARKVETAERKAAAPVITVERIEAAFAAARESGKKRLKLRLDTFTFKPASATSSNPGAIYVTEGDIYLGKVVAGKFQAVHACGDERTARVLAAAADPEKAAIAYGMRTGTCSCCGAELTNKESIDRGIGPICAAKWGW